ncbi:hypothetical protein GPECTOR_102g52 [Gonium pectorale]|uniref:PAS domain-containing protein n=1 Tax=Gonium pectorale TaxID=33097 RepID=A0A150FZS8_GONPE|nr:hypothetical protein GPECTOR_102g52 [Gonium pectorale]|eukprot:KXZ43099.1 hypothetical protein GPECTOR_102g52 [Gonium pectorale]
MQRRRFVSWLGSPLPPLLQNAASRAASFLTANPLREAPVRAQRRWSDAGGGEGGAEPWGGTRRRRLLWLHKYCGQVGYKTNFTTGAVGSLKYIVVSLRHLPPHKFAGRVGYAGRRYRGSAADHPGGGPPGPRPCPFPVGGPADMLLVADGSGRVLHVTPPVAEALGRSAESIRAGGLGLLLPEPLALLHGPWVQGLDLAVSGPGRPDAPAPPAPPQSCRSGVPVYLSGHTARDGPVRLPFRLRIEPRLIEGGERRVYAVSLSKITEEEALSHRRLRLEVEMDGTISSAGPSPESLFGVNAESLVGTSIAQLLDAFAPLRQQEHQPQHYPAPAAAAPASNSGSMWPVPAAAGGPLDVGPVPMSPRGPHGAGGVGSRSRLSLVAPAGPGPAGGGRAGDIARLLISLAKRSSESQGVSWRVGVVPPADPDTEAELARVSRHLAPHDLPAAAAMLLPRPVPAVMRVRLLRRLDPLDRTPAGEGGGAAGAVPEPQPQPRLHLSPVIVDVAGGGSRLRLLEPRQPQPSLALELELWRADLLTGVLAVDERGRLLRADVEPAPGTGAGHSFSVTASLAEPEVSHLLQRLLSSRSSLRAGTARPSAPPELLLEAPPLACEALEPHPLQPELELEPPVPEPEPEPLRPSAGAAEAQRQQDAAATSSPATGARGISLRAALAGTRPPGAAYPHTSPTAPSAGGGRWTIGAPPAPLGPGGDAAGVGDGARHVPPPPGFRSREAQALSEPVLPVGLHGSADKHYRGGEHNSGSSRVGGEADPEAKNIERAKPMTAAAARAVLPAWIAQEQGYAVAKITSIARAPGPSGGSGAARRDAPGPSVVEPGEAERNGPGSGGTTGRLARGGGGDAASKRGPPVQRPATEPDVDDARSSEGSSALADEAATVANADGTGAGQRYKRISKLLAGPVANEPFRRLKLCTYVVLALLVALHTTTFAVLLRKTNLNEQITALDSAAWACRHIHEVAIRGRALEALLGGEPWHVPGLRVFGEPLGESLRGQLDGLLETTQALKERHHGVYLGFLSLRGLQGSSDLKDLWEGPSLPIKVFYGAPSYADARPAEASSPMAASAAATAGELQSGEPAVELMGLWDAGNEFITQALSLHSGAQRLVLQGGNGSAAGAGDDDGGGGGISAWGPLQFIKANGPPVLFHAYGRALDAMVHTTATELRRVFAFQLAFLLVEGILACGVAAAAFSSKVFAFYDLLLRVPLGFARSQALACIAVDPDEEREGQPQGAQEAEAEGWLHHALHNTVHGGSALAVADGDGDAAAPGGGDGDGYADDDADDGGDGGLDGNDGGKAAAAAAARSRTGSRKAMHLKHYMDPGLVSGSLKLSFQQPQPSQQQLAAVGGTAGSSGREASGGVLGSGRSWDQRRRVFSWSGGASRAGALSWVGRVMSQFGASQALRKAATTRTASGGLQRRLLLRSRRTAVALTAPVLLWAAVVVSVGLAGVALMGGMDVSVANLNVVHSFSIRFHRVLFSALELCAAPRWAPTADLRAALASELEGMKTEYTVMLYGVQALPHLANSSHFGLARTGVLFAGEPKPAEIIYHTSGCLAEDPANCKPTSSPYHQVTKQGLDVLVKSQYAHVESLLAQEAGRRLSLNYTGFRFIWDTSETDMEGGLVREGGRAGGRVCVDRLTNAYYEGVQMRLRREEALHIVFFVLVWLWVLAFLFLRLRPVLSQARREIQQIGMLLSSLPREAEVETLFARQIPGLVPDQRQQQQKQHQQQQQKQQQQPVEQLAQRQGKQPLNAKAITVRPGARYGRPPS